MERFNTAPGVLEVELVGLPWERPSVSLWLPPVSNLGNNPQGMPRGFCSETLPYVAYSKRSKMLPSPF